jgi:hypothetical protein
LFPDIQVVLHEVRATRDEYLYAIDGSYMALERIGSPLFGGYAKKRRPQRAVGKASLVLRPIRQASGNRTLFSAVPHSIQRLRYPDARAWLSLLERDIELRGGVTHPYLIADESSNSGWKSTHWGCFSK